MKYHLRVYDNYHYMDESEAYNYGQYDSYEDALVAARLIVDEFFVRHWTKGASPDALMAQYCMYGEDPVILPGDFPGHERFSARAYAEVSAFEICRKLENS